MSQDSTQTWLPIGAAARAAGVARRSAFRWIGRGLLEVRQVEGRRLVEVGALRALGTVSGAGATLAQINAASSLSAAMAQDCATPGHGSPPPPSTAEVIESLQWDIESLQKGLIIVGQRLAEVERRLGIVLRW